MRIFECVVVLAACAMAAEKPSRELIVCGWDEVFILDMAATPPAKVWSWKAPEQYRDQFKSTDDCKPVDGGSKILISSSSDGIALVDRKTRKMLFHAAAGGAHSIEFLPKGRIAVAASTSDRPLNNSLVIFDLKRPERPLFVDELRNGHGVVWDGKRQVLWAMGGRVLRQYRPDPALKKVKEFTLPDDDGHDLMAIPHSELLSLTTHHSAWVFDRDTENFAPHPQLAGKENVKCITVHPKTGEMVWTQADPGFWWTATLRFLNPEGTHELAGQRLYKARWVDVP